MRKLFTVALGLCAATGLAVAQESPQWEVSGGYQYTRVDVASVPAQANLFTESAGIPNLNIPSSVNASGFNFGVQENLNSWFGGIFQFSGSYPTLNLNITPQLLASGVQTSVPNATYIAQSKGQLYTFMFGPQFTLRKNPYIQPFVRVMLGGARDSLKLNVAENGAKLLASDLQTDDTGLALGGGAGVDIRITNRVYFRAAGDVVRTTLFNDTEKNVCISAGITYRIGSK
jgi:opacity protein-like surface antigen